MKKICASVTVFLALSLETFILLILTLLFLCIRNGEYVRFETAVDVSMNSVLGEYCRALFDEFGLIYIDTSYLGGAPGIERTENRIDFYLRKNTTEVYEENNGPWGKISPQKVVITDFRAATAGNGKSFRNQISQYGQRVGFSPESQYSVGAASDAGAENIELIDFFEYWNGIKETLNGMEKPKKKDPITGIESEVDVDDPADLVFGMLGNDVPVLSEIETGSISGSFANVEELISNREKLNTDNGPVSDGNREDFLKYLSDFFGCYQKESEKRLLKYELEYILYGFGVDSQNMQAAFDDIFRIRLTDNFNAVNSNSEIGNRAKQIAEGLEICTLDSKFIEPITESIICGAVFLESVADMKMLAHGEKVAFHKGGVAVKVENVLSGTVPSGLQQGGLSYKEYLLVLLMQRDITELSYRMMDVMELNVRKQTENPDFSMDWCIERITARLIGFGSQKNQMQVNRIYGFY